MVLRKSVKVSDDVYGELARLKEELGLPSPNRVIRRLIELYRSGRLGHPLDSAVTCTARRVGENAYIVRCRDGRTAYVPENTLAELCRRYGDAILVEEG